MTAPALAPSGALVAFDRPELWLSLRVGHEDRDLAHRDERIFLKFVYRSFHLKVRLRDSDN